VAGVVAGRHSGGKGGWDVASASEVLEVIARGVGIIGVAVILWGVAVTAVSTIRVEAVAVRGRHVPGSRMLLRQQLGASLLLGLEFLIAADVIRTVLQPTLQEVGILGGIVAIRTVLSYFLHKEMAADQVPVREREATGAPQDRSQPRQMR